MRERRATTLPSPLNDYLISSESYEKINRPKETQPPEKEQKVSTKKQRSSPERQSPHTYSYKHRTPTPGDTVRSARHTKAEDERLERVADNWDQAKAEVLQERHNLLNQKLALQQQLIKAQDRRSELIRQEEEDARAKKRNDEKRLKQAKFAALQEHSKLSKDSDHKSKKKAETSETDAPSSARYSAEGDGERTSETSSPVAGSVESGNSSQKRGRRPGHTGYLPSDSYVPATSPMKELEDEEEDEEGNNRTAAGEGVVTPADLSSVPWHHAQLYKMYGRNADYYIHPKMQPEKKKIVNPGLKSQKGHLGASHIWTTLRGDSMGKLHRTDQRFPQELKVAFSAHVRDGITKHKKPVFRNFTETEDVPDLNRLMDQSLLRHIRVLRHKTELMYRSSQTNHDRTKILLFNSPLPAVNEGDEGIDRYLPSWDDAASVNTEASYMRWIKNKKITDTAYEKGVDISQDEAEDGENIPPQAHKSRHPVSVLSPVGSDVSEGLQTIWHSIMARQRPRKEPRYHFLTEEEARTPGAFLSKLGLDKDKLDQGRTDLLPQLEGEGPMRRSVPSIKSHSAQEMRSLRHSQAGFPHSRSESATNSQSSRYETRWQPLSMNALVEYKEQMATEGRGEFKQGRPKMWNTVISQE